MSFTYETILERGQTFAQITGYEGSARTIVVPDTIGGLVVRSIGAFAFAGKNTTEEIILPASVKTLRLFAFQNCASLRRISMFNTTDDYYDGVIRGCTSLREIVVRMAEPDNFVIVREFLRDTEAELHFVLELPDKDEKRLDATDVVRPDAAAPRQIRLTFPEYVSEATEDTWARVIHISIEGAGVSFRECVTRNKIDFAGYDRLLPRLTAYDAAAATDISLDRLQTPVELSEEAKDQYRTYITTHAEEVLQLLLERGDGRIADADLEALRFMTRENLIPLEDREILESAIHLASELGLTEACGILMAYGQKREVPKRQRRTLSL